MRCPQSESRVSDHTKHTLFKECTHGEASKEVDGAARLGVVLVNCNLSGLIGVLTVGGGQHLLEKSSNEHRLLI